LVGFELAFPMQFSLMPLGFLTPAQAWYDHSSSLNTVLGGYFGSTRRGD
jgi:hypothetical protein